MFRGETSKRIKFTLPGPMTMMDTLYDAHYRSREKLALEFAQILNDEARDLEAVFYLDEVRDWGVAALMRAREGLNCTTAVHICYGYGIQANLEWKKTLGSEWRQYDSIFPLLAASEIDQVSLECANSRVPLELMSLLAGKDVLVGAIDVASLVVETPEQVAAVIRAAMKFVPVERIQPCTNCGMAPLPREVARGKLRALTPGAALVRAELA